MAKDLTLARKGRLPGQDGFSMIEMLMTAFILAIGLLGLSMLQTMSMRAGRGSASLTTAVHVANTVMDQVELEGRMSWLNIQYNQNTTLAALPSPFYLALAKTTSLTQTFNLQGDPPDPTSTDPAVVNPFYTVTVTRLNDLGTPKGSGQLSDFNVQVQFSDMVAKNNTAILRKINLTRRILHG